MGKKKDPLSRDTQSTKPGPETILKLEISSTLNLGSSAGKESTCNAGDFLGWEDPQEKG